MSNVQGYCSCCNGTSLTPLVQGVRRPGVQGVQTRMPMVIPQTIRPQGTGTAQRPLSLCRQWSSSIGHPGALDLRYC